MRSQSVVLSMTGRTWSRSPTDAETSGAVRREQEATGGSGGWRVARGSDFYSPPLLDFPNEMLINRGRGKAVANVIQNMRQKKVEVWF